jgi:hypothetical protein
MKRILALIIFCSIFLIACPPLPWHTAFSKIEYEAFSRGASEYILVEQGQIKYVENRQDTISKPLKKKHYKELYEFLKDLELSSLETLEVPSTRHQTDAALAASLAITDKDQNEYVTPTFDDDNPPQEIKELVAYLKGLTKE